jgi:fluoride exporter
MQNFFWLMLGCALGGVARLALATAIASRTGTTFPWGTLAVNVSGALALGVLAGAAGAGWFADPRLWHFAVSGFLGSYTTVSSFILQTLALLYEGEHRRAATNVAVSLGACLGAVALGMTIAARALTQA